MPYTRIGVLGGAFDPVHTGHLRIAEAARTELSLAKVIFMPGARTPLKNHAPKASDEDRLELLRSAVGIGNGMEISDWEIRKGGISYSIDTALHLRESLPESEIFWIIGADQLARLNLWSRIEDLGRIVTFAVAHRDGDCKKPPRDLPPCVKTVQLSPKALDISSTEIRRLLRERSSVAQNFLPEKTLNLIRAKGLYLD